MKQCNRWQKQLTAYVLGDLDTQARAGLAVHLESCEACRRELELTRAILTGAADIREEAERAMDGVHWDALETRLYSGTTPSHVPMFRYAVQSLMALCLVIPVVFLTMMDRPEPISIHVNAETVKRMEVELARKEVSRYLHKSRLVLADFMQQCPPERMPVDWAPSPAVRDLLTENRYFADDLDAYRLANARDLCRKLNLVFAEMSTVNVTDPCQDIHRLQQLVERENLFLKIRLVEQELNVDEV